MILTNERACHIKNPSVIPEIFGRGLYIRQKVVTSAEDLVFGRTLVFDRTSGTFWDRSLGFGRRAKSDLRLNTLWKCWCLLGNTKYAK